MAGAAATSSLLTSRPSGPGLFGDQHLAEHGLGLFVNVLGGLAQLDAALEAALERSLAASAGVDLRFDDDQLRACGEEFFGDCFGGFRRVANVPGGHGDAVLGEQLFGLVFVNVHRNKVACQKLMG